MPPKRASRSCADDLFRSKLDNIIDPLHELVQLGGLIVWPGFENAFGRFYRSASRPALPARLMVGLCYLKHAFDVGDERLLELGMMQALTRFEPDRSFRFATYATWWIKAAIREYVMRNRSLVRMETTAAQKSCSSISDA